jgi:hypothetical protein
MELQDIGLGLAGILVSVLTFALGYRQTIGARQIRISAANDALVETLLRVIVVEQLDVTSEDIETALNGRAAKIGVVRDALMSARQVADVLHHQILSSDLIAKADRERALSAATGLRKALSPPSLLVQRQVIRRGRGTIFLPVVVLAIVTATFGVGIVIVFSSNGAQSDKTALLVQFGITLALALVTAGFLAARYRTLSSTQFAESSHPLLRELLNYPDAAEGIPDLNVLQTLSPFAVRNLFQLGRDEVSSLRNNVSIGLAGDPSTSLGLQELLDKRLAEKVGKPNGSKSKREWYALTSRGRSVGRLLQPSVEQWDADVPDYLLPFASPAGRSPDYEAKSDAD